MRGWLAWLFVWSSTGAVGKVTCRLLPPWEAPFSPSLFHQIRINRRFVQWYQRSLILPISNADGLDAKPCHRSAYSPYLQLPLPSHEITSNVRNKLISVKVVPPHLTPTSSPHFATRNGYSSKLKTSTTTIMMPSFLYKTKDKSYITNITPAKPV